MVLTPYLRIRSPGFSAGTHPSRRMAATVLLQKSPGAPSTPLVFRPDYPMVLNHDDLLEMNIHVDEKTGLMPLLPHSAHRSTVWKLSWASRPRHPGTSILVTNTTECSSGKLSTVLLEHFQTVTGGQPKSRGYLVCFEPIGFGRRPQKDNAAPLEEGDQEFVCLEAFCLR
jgi:hypothetical protein